MNVSLITWPGYGLWFIAQEKDPARGLNLNIQAGSVAGALVCSREALAVDPPSRALGASSSIRAIHAETSRA